MFDNSWKNCSSFFLMTAILMSELDVYTSIITDALSID